MKIFVTVFFAQKQDLFFPHGDPCFGWLVMGLVTINVTNNFLSTNWIYFHVLQFQYGSLAG